MPVTAKLSRRFYEQFGDDLTNELVDWLNAVDATYRSDLRETNELNFARFMAWVDQKFAEADARFEKRFAAIDVRFAAVDAKFDGLDARFDGLDARFDRIDAKFAAIDLRFAGVDRKFDGSELMKWMFLYWTGTMLALAAFLVTILLRG
jgi:hypothetical protein